MNVAVRCLIVIAIFIILVIFSTIINNRVKKKNRFDGKLYAVQPKEGDPALLLEVDDVKDVVDKEYVTLKVVKSKEWID